MDAAAGIVAVTVAIAGIDGKAVSGISDQRGVLAGG